MAVPSKSQIVVGQASLSKVNESGSIEGLQIEKDCFKVLEDLD